MSVAEPNVMILGTKQPDEGKGLIVRLWEIGGAATTAHLRLDPHLAGKKAQATSVMEDPQGPLEIQNDTVAVPVRARGVATVRIE
jgi:hypothetical protein